MDFLDKLLKITTHDDRIIIGRLKSLDYLGNLYLGQSVEVFDKNDDYYTPLDIYKNTNDYNLNFESDKNCYQLTGTTIIKKESIKNIKL